ncbi:MAG: hypothetical protein OEM24_11605 [Paracoccaceae bacterium]|nr:hypothetical protein [Paracoccaceae bacterium]
MDDANRTAPRVEAMKRYLSGFSLILFPMMLLAGFVSHPDILSFEMVTSVDDWVAEWRGNPMFHFGHLLVLFAVPPIIAASLRLMSLLQGRGAWLGFIGGVLAVFGAFMLAVDKGALTLVLTAFQSIPDPEFADIAPALQALLDRAGWLWITWGFIVLPIGFALQIAGLMRERIIPVWQGVAVIAGLLLLINPDIEIISSAGALLMCLGLIPMGLRDLQGTLASEA